MFPMPLLTHVYSLRLHGIFWRQTGLPDGKFQAEGSSSDDIGARTAGLGFEAHLRFERNSPSRAMAGSRTLRSAA